jgi:hypothetical protein
MQLAGFPASEKTAARLGRKLKRGRGSFAIDIMFGEDVELIRSGMLLLTDLASARPIGTTNSATAQRQPRQNWSVRVPSGELL